MQAIFKTLLKWKLAPLLSLPPSNLVALPGKKAIRQRGTIKSIIADKRFGFITDGNDSFHFTFDAFAAREKPDVGMQVEFEPQDSFNKKRNQRGKIAVNVRPVRAANTNT